jgi:hypothetical protein
MSHIKILQGYVSGVLIFVGLVADKADGGAQEAVVQYLASPWPAG